MLEVKADDAWNLLVVSCIEGATLLASTLCGTLLDELRIPRKCGNSLRIAILGAILTAIVSDQGGALSMAQWAAKSDLVGYPNREMH